MRVRWAISFSFPPIECLHLTPLRATLRPRGSHDKTRPRSSMGGAMERLDKHENRTFYDTQREHDRRRFEEEPTKAFMTETLVPWVLSALPENARIVDI